VSTSAVSVVELLQRGFADHQAGRLQPAEATYRRILAIEPRHSDALHLLGLLAHQSERNEQAINLVRQAISLNGARPGYHSSLGAIQYELGRPTEAEASLRTALRLRPDSPTALNNLGMTLCSLGRYAEAEANCREALLLQPDLHDAHNNLGTALAALGRSAEAEASYLEALRLKPDHAGAHTNRGMALLLAGQFEEGWREYEWRWKSGYMAKRVRNFPGPLWNGEAIGDRVLLLYAEQGLGDTVQFCRYVPLVSGGARVVLEVQASLVRLLSRLPGVAQIVARGEPLPPFDLHCPLLSLPRAFGTTLETIPANVPYLAADAAEVAVWRKRLASLPGFRVGLVWAGGPRTPVPKLIAIDQRRSLTLKTLAPLAEIAGVSFVSLQKSSPAAQAADPPPGMALADFSVELHDFAATAALIEALDLVISVDTSVAHLAGALGKPVWLLNRFDNCWRWMLKRADSPWYPTLRQFRQPSPGDWSSVISDVKNALQRFVAGDRSQLLPPRDVLDSAASASVSDTGMSAHAPQVSVADLWKQALAHHQAGRLQPAETICRQILALEPSHADALHVLGLIAHQSGRHERALMLVSRAIAADATQPNFHRHLGLILCDLRRPAEAEASLRTALTLRPDYPAAFNSLGIALYALGRPQEAEASYRDALRLEPDFPEALNGLGITLYALGRPAEAEASCREALRLRPKFPDAHNTLGTALFGLNRAAEAVWSYRDALRLRPAYPAALNNLGNALMALGRPAEAEANYREALRINPAFADAHTALGRVLAAAGRPADAEASYRAALRLRPRSADALNSFGAAVYALGQLPEAEASYRAALRLQPDHAGALNNLGNVLFALGRPVQAEASHREAVRLNPTLVEGFGDLGRVLATLGRSADADASYLEALRLKPDHADAHANRGMALLLAGRFEEGWREYEWRWKSGYMAKRARNFPAPLWSGEAIGDRVLLLHAEQGLGDTLQFCRYVPLVSGGARVVLEVQASLVRLLSRLPGVAQIVARGEPLPPFDLHCPLLSLPRAFGTTLETIPANVPYLAADAAEVAVWRKRLASLPGFRVGLVWAGGPRTPVPKLIAIDQRRSLTLKTLAPLAEIAGVSFVSLQKSSPAAQAADPPPGMALADFSVELHDFAATAALIEALDLVISVDTSVAHLAGALGKPVWLLNRFDNCWRWMLKRADSPWYPTLRQFRQPSPGDWSSVISDVKDGLQLAVAG